MKIQICITEINYIKKKHLKSFERLCLCVCIYIYIIAVIGVNVLR